MNKFIGNFRKEDRPELFADLPKETEWIVIESIDSIDDVLEYDQFRVHIGHNGIYDNNYIVATNDGVIFSIYHGHQHIDTVTSTVFDLTESVIACYAKGLKTENRLSHYTHMKEKPC